MIQINAHRGDPLRHCENTMPAFASAIAFGADSIELDIQVSLDDQAVVLHDATLERLWKIDKPVFELTYNDIFSMTKQKQADVYVPRLEEVLNDFDIPIMVDFTDTTAVPPIVRVLQEQHAVSRCLISSGNIEALTLIRKALKNIEIALTWNDIIPPSDTLLQELDVQCFNPNYRIYEDAFVEQVLTLRHSQDKVFKELLERRANHPEWYTMNDRCGSHMVKRMQDTGRKVSAWTVDDPTTMCKMIELGIDLITTNDTKTLMEVRNG